MFENPCEMEPRLPSDREGALAELALGTARVLCAQQHATDRDKSLGGRSVAADE